MRNGLWLGIACSLLMACGDDASTEEPSGDAGDADTSGGDGDGGRDLDGGIDGGDAGAAPLPELSDDPTEVTLHDGSLRGDGDGESVRFLKIPYALAPVGELRWKAPVDNEPWEGVRAETDFASPCPQAPSQQSAMSVDEDCLYLNVWRPEVVTPGAPVMVWIHGGGFTTGSAADFVPTSTDFLWYDGRPFAERGIVVVTLNYRLGVFGFFAHEALAGEGSPVGNQGLLDQQHALRWVRDNIERFGGDPENVTIFGESAGAGSVCMHLASPGSRGLFHRAVSQSGGCTQPRSGLSGDTDRAALDEQLAMFTAEHDCAGDDPLACLRELPASEFISDEVVDRTMGMGALRANFRFGPVVDGEGGFLPERAGELFDRGEIANVPYILGTNTEEAQLYFIQAAVPADEAEYVAAITGTYGDFAERVLETYPSERFEGSYRRAMARIATDSGLVCGTMDTARRAAAAGLEVYMYNFNVDWSIAGGVLGPSHASEISHVFGTPYEESDENVAVAEVMNTYWATFAKTGDPNYDGAPAVWPRYLPDEDDNDQRLQLDPEYEVLESFRKEECLLWREYASAQTD
jgi:para-nitrobenzyl esterase